MTNVFQQPYYRINKCLLNVIGQWPYLSRGKRFGAIAVYLGLLSSILIPQILLILDFPSDISLIVEDFSILSIDFACSIKLANMAINSGKMVKIFERIEIDWISVAEQPEVLLMLGEYAERGRQFTIAYTDALGVQNEESMKEMKIFVTPTPLDVAIRDEVQVSFLVGTYIAMLLFMTEPVMPKLLEIMKSTNESLPGKFPFPIDYYHVDMDKYYFYIVLHSYIIAMVSCTIIIALDTMFIVQVQHACGMFTVVGNQLRKMADEVPEAHMLYSCPMDDPAFRHLTICIKKHNDVIKFSELLDATYTWAFFSSVGANMLVMSVTGFQAVMKINNSSSNDAIRYAGLTMAQMVHLFFQSFFSQRLTDHSQQVREQLCVYGLLSRLIQAEWYKMSLYAQKLLNLIAMRTHVPCQLTAGKFLVMSLETFSLIVKTSMSYFTLLRRVQ